MSRSVTEWIGKTDDTPVPDRVKARNLRQHEFKCWRCGCPIVPGRPWQCDHKVALINGGPNRESNLGPLCEFCMPVKNAEDVAEKADTDAMTKGAFGIKKAKHPMRGGRSDTVGKRLDGTVFDRRTGRPLNRREN